MIDKINIREKLARFTARWNPKIVAELNGKHVKLVKFEGPFIWHRRRGRGEDGGRAGVDLSEGESPKLPPWGL